MEQDKSDSSNNAVFYSLKPACDKLILNATQESVENLSRVIEQIPSKALARFQSYVCFPIEVQLLKSSSSQQIIWLVEVLEKVFKASFVDSPKTLIRISTLLFQKVVNNNGNFAIVPVPEELKLSVVRCLTTVWTSAMTDVLYEVYDQDHHPKLSSLIFMLVQLAKAEKMIQLRAAALECLQVICHVHSAADPSDLEMRHRAASVIMQMLPGVVSCCAHIAAEPSTLNHKVVVANVELWSRVVCLVMADATSAVEGEEEGRERRQGEGRVLWQVRSAQWLNGTGQRLTAVTESMLSAQTHSHWMVRRQLVHACRALLTTCPSNMSGSVGSLVCCLIALGEDSMEEVRSEAARALTQVSLSLEHDTGQSLLQLVEEAFYSLLTRAPRIMHSSDDASQLTCLSLLVGFLRLQGPRLPQVLCSGPFLHRLLVTLTRIATLETGHISLLEESTIREVESEDVVTEEWRRLQVCDSPDKLAKLEAICAILRERADLPVITHTLLDLLDNSPEHTKETILLLNLTLAGGSAKSMEAEADLVKTVVAAYLQPVLWNVPLSVSENSAISISQAQSNIVQVSLLAEGLGMFALAIGGPQFNTCLLRCLYPLLECAGSPLHPIATAGLVAVQRVASACVGAGVTELVRANVDYLSHHVGLRLRRAAHCPGVLGVLSVIMRHSSVHVMPSLHLIIEDVLVQSWSDFLENNANGFLRVFLTFVECVRGWQPKQVEQQTTEPAKQLTALQQLVEYKRCRDTADNLSDDEPIPDNVTADMFASEQPDAKDAGAEVEGENEKPRPVEPSVKLTVAVLERALHFLPSKDEQRQILVLEILRSGVLALASEQDQLLPVVHKVWSPLVGRLRASLTRPLVLQRAFALLCTLAATAKDFIRHRTLKDVLPGLCAVLEDNARHSERQDAGSAYRLTQLFKLQRALLAGLGQLARDLDLQEADLNRILCASTPYLSQHQPRPLQELCVELHIQLSVPYRNLVWLHLLSVWSPTLTLKPPSSDLKTVQLDTCNDESSPFRRNVTKLLESLGCRNLGS